MGVLNILWVPKSRIMDFTWGTCLIVIIVLNTSFLLKIKFHAEVKQNKKCFYNYITNKTVFKNVKIIPYDLQNIYNIIF